MKFFRDLMSFIRGRIPSGGAFNSNWPRVPHGHVADVFGVGARKLRHG